MHRQTILMYGDACGQDMNTKAMRRIQMLSRLNSANQIKSHENESDQGIWHPFANRKSHCYRQHSIDFVWKTILLTRVSSFI